MPTKTPLPLRTMGILLHFLADKCVGSGYIRITIWLYAANTRLCNLDVTLAN
ncbi:MAG: hypothetical protein WBA90_09385 [Albidovulum sp.]